MLKKYNDLSLNRTIRVNSLLTAIWWIVFSPGFYSGDSFAVIEMAKSGKITSEWTYIWAALTNFLSLNGQFPEIATLVYSQVFAFAVTVYSFAVFGSKGAGISSIVLCTTPLIGAMGVTLWHDIPMTTGFLLVIVGTLKVIRGEKWGIAYSIVGMLFSSFRYNGIPTILLFLIFLVLSSRQTRNLFFLLVICVLVLAGTTFTNTNSQSITNVQYEGFFDWMQYDLACYAAEHDDKKFFSEYFNDANDINAWKSSSACAWFNDSQVKNQQIPVDKSELITAWKQVFFSKPFYIINLHMKRHHYLLPIPIYGLQRVPFIHTNIEFSERGISPKFPDLYESLRIFPRVWNFFSFIFAQAGFWMMISLLTNRYRKEKVWNQPSVLSFILVLSLFVFAPIPDSRFALFVLISGQLGFLHALFSSAIRRQIS